MKLSHPLLNLPARTAVRALALRSLHRLVRGAERFRGGAEEAEVKKVRIALRRLRGLEREFRPWLEGAVTRKDRRRLRGLADAAGPVRDLELQVQWLRAGRGAWNAVEAVGRDWLLRRLEERQPAAEAALRAALDDRLPRLRERLERRLPRYEVRVDPEKLAPPALTRQVVAERVERRAARLRSRLAAVDTVADQEPAHRARIAARRLRYLLDPFRGESASVAGAVEALRSLQALLGDLHDGEIVLAAVHEAIDDLGDGEGAVRAGLLDLAEQLRLRRDVVFGEIAAGWLHGNAEPLFRRLGALVEELRGPAADREIERKYLLRAMPALPQSADPVRIEQGWLPGERLLERVRMVESAEGRRWYRTVKLGRGVQRVEVEEETSEEVFAALWALTGGRRIRKRRFRVPHEGRVWEIDRFEEPDLVLAEVELDSPDDPVVLPPWLEPVVEREVTEEPEYVNANLAR